MAVDLKPCPWCNAIPEKDSSGDERDDDSMQWIKCENQRCIVRPSIYQHQDDYGRFDIDEEWNTRAEQVQQKEEKSNAG